MCSLIPRSQASFSVQAEQGPGNEIGGILPQLETRLVVLVRGHY